jgi:hypothetical protein
MDKPFCEMGCGERRKGSCYIPNRGCVKTKHFGVHVADAHCYEQPTQGQPGLHNATHLIEIIHLYEIRSPSFPEVCKELDSSLRWNDDASEA